MGDEEMDLRDIFRFYAQDFVWIRNSASERKAKEEKEIIRRAIGDIATAIALDTKDMDLLNGIEKRIESAKKRIEEMKRRFDEDERARIEGLRIKLQEKLKKAGFADVFLKIEETEKAKAGLLMLSAKSWKNFCKGDNMSYIIILGLFFLALGFIAFIQAPKVYKEAYNWEEGYKTGNLIGAISSILGIVFTILGVLG